MTLSGIIGRGLVLGAEASDIGCRSALAHARLTFRWPRSAAVCSKRCRIQLHSPLVQCCAVGGEGMCATDNNEEYLDNKHRRTRDVNQNQDCMRNVDSTLSGGTLNMNQPVRQEERSGQAVKFAPENLTAHASGSPSPSLYASHSLIPESERRLLHQSMESEHDADSCTRVVLGNERGGQASSQAVAAFSNGWDERWLHVVSFPDKVIRDLAFVMFCPMLLHSSEKLPLAPSALIGSHPSTLPSSLQWLETLDAGLVQEWFTQNHRSHRLGDHYALCVEYVARFGPHIQPTELYSSVQVQSRTKPPHKPTIPQGGAGTQTRPAPEEAPESTANSECPEVPGGEKLPELGGVPGSQLASAKARQEPKRTQPVEVKQKAGDEAALKIGVPSGDAQLPGEGSRGEVFLEGMPLLFAGRDEDDGGWSEGCPGDVGGGRGVDTDLLVEHAQHADRKGQSSREQSSREQSRKEQSSIGQRSEEQISEGKERPGKKLSRWERREQWRAKNGGAGIVTTVGEFDLLFTENVQQQGAAASCGEKEKHEADEAESAAALQEPQPRNVFHWELSVKFLLYVGPWESLGVQAASKTESVWNQRVKAAYEKMVTSETDESLLQDSAREGRVNGTASSSSAAAGLFASLEDLDHGEELLGLFLGPHVGESLRGRRQRLVRQLKLGFCSLGSMRIQSLFGSEVSDGDSAASATGLVDASDSLSHVHGKLTGETLVPDSFLVVVKPHVEDGPEEARPRCVLSLSSGEKLQVVPEAVLQGYLFYEIPLFRALLKKSSQSEKNERSLWEADVDRVYNASTSFDVHQRDSRDNKNQLSECLDLNRRHWFGWWTSDLNVVVNGVATRTLPEDAERRWIILQRLEWLSPMVVLPNDPKNLDRLRAPNDFIFEIQAMQERAKEKGNLRQARVLVAELMKTNKVPSSKLHVDSWIEISRGFIIEKSWPL